MIQKSNKFFQIFKKFFLARIKGEQKSGTTANFADFPSECSEKRLNTGLRGQICWSSFKKAVLRERK